MAKNKDLLPQTFDTVEEIADFWDTHDLSDYEESLTLVEMQVVSQPKHEYVVVLSDSLNVLLGQIQRREGVSLNTLINLWIQEKLQQLISLYPINKEMPMQPTP